MVEVSIRQVEELLFEGFQKPDSNIKTIVSSMSKLIWVSDRPKWPSCLGSHIKSASRVPSTSSTTTENIKPHKYLKQLPLSKRKENKTIRGVGEIVLR